MKIGHSDRDLIPIALLLSIRLTEHYRMQVFTAVTTCRDVGALNDGSKTIRRTEYATGRAEASPRSTRYTRAHLPLQLFLPRTVLPDLIDRIAGLFVEL